MATYFPGELFEAGITAREYDELTESLDHHITDEIPVVVPSNEAALFTGAYDPVSLGGIPRRPLFGVSVQQHYED